MERRSAALICALVLPACGGSGTEGTSVDAAGDAPSGRDGAATDAGNETGVDGSLDGGRDAAPEEFPTQPFWGGPVLVTNEENARELRVLFRREAASCTLEGVAGCHVEYCPRGEPVEPPHAGHIRVASSGGELLTDPRTDGTYPGDTGIGALWAPGDPVRFQADGGEIAAFDETMSAPAPFEPVQLPEEGATISRSEPLTVRWSGARNSTFLLAFAVDSLQVRCFAPGEAGELTVAPEVLQRLPAGSSGAVVAIAEKRRVLDRANNLRVRLIARSNQATRSASFE